MLSQWRRGGEDMPSRQQYPVDIIFEGGMGEDLGKFNLICELWHYPEVNPEAKQYARVAIE